MARRVPQGEWFRGAEFVAADVFDAGLVGRIVAETKPDVIIHQLTDLSGLGNPAGYADAIKRNARIRAEGTRNLVRAAQAAKVRA
jgi:nucleoside-diphosphate-sugar epimerase